jgi:VanZ family protein
MAAEVPAVSLACVDGKELLTRWGAGVVISTGLLVVIGGLFPFDFHMSNELNVIGAIRQFDGLGNLADWICNIVLFIPLGLGLSAVSENLKLSATFKCAVVVGVCIGVSTSVELLQLFLPSRFPALADIAANGLGGMVGFIGFSRWKQKIHTGLSALVKHRRRYLSSRNLAAVLVGYFVLWCLTSFVLTRTAKLTNWDESFTLLLGNEHTGDRPWSGLVSQVIVADTAIPGRDVERAFAEAGYWQTLGSSLVVHYDLGHRGSFQDQVRRLPELAWQPGDVSRSETRDKAGSNEVEDAGVVLSPNQWLETQGPARFLTESIRKTSQFTLSVTLAAADRWQTGPARIISLSGGPYVRNFTLGQENTDLIVRLRTRGSGENGLSPELTIPNVFANRTAHRIIVVYDGRYFRLYVDDALNSFSLNMIDVALMNPGSVLDALRPGAVPEPFTLDLSSVNTYGYKILYFAVMFVPFGSLMSLITLVVNGRSVTHGLAIAISLVMAASTIEGILAYSTDGLLSLANITVGVVFAVSAMLPCRIWASSWLFDNAITARSHAPAATITG